MAKLKSEKGKAANLQKKQAAPEKQPQSSAAAVLLRNSAVLYGGILFALLLLAVIFSGSMTLNVEKICGLLGCIAVVVLSVFAAKKMGQQAGFLLLCVTTYVIWGMISTQYAYAGKFALSESTKLIVAYAFFLLMVLFAPKKLQTMRCVAYVIATLTALIGLLSADAANGGAIGTTLLNALEACTQLYHIKGAAFNGTRIGTLFANANIYGELMSLGIVCSFWVAFHAKKRFEKLLGAMLIAVNVYADILAMSMVAIAVCFVACLALALLSQKEHRLSYLLLMAESAVVALAALLLSYSALGTKSMLPVLCCLVSGVALFALDGAVRLSLAKAIEKVNRTARFAAIGAVLALAAGAAYVVLNTPAPYQLAAGETLGRTVILRPGEYELQIDAENPAQAQALVRSFSNRMTRIAKATELFSGPAGTAQVSVPEDSAFCHIRITLDKAAQSQSITSIRYTGTESGSVATGYRFLPNFVANRLQSLSTAETLHQRGYLFGSGMALFAKKPIIGTGLGGYENSLLSVQPFHMESKYAHNHYLQTLCDLGIIGFLLYLGILIFAVRLLWIHRKDEQLGQYCPVLAALLIAMFGGALSDVAWSSGNYLPVAFTILGVEAALLEGGFAPESKARKVTRFVPYVVAAVFLMFGVALAVNMSVVKSTENGVTFTGLEAAAQKDLFEANDYLYGYVNNAYSSNSETVQRNALKYADRLAKEKSNTMGKELARFYFSRDMLDEGFACMEDYVSRNRSKAASWQQAFDTLRGFDPVLHDGSLNRAVLPSVPDAAPRIAALAERMEQVSAEQLDTLTLDDETVMWLTRVGYIAAEQISDTDEIVDAFSNLVYDSRFAQDFDEDGLPDLLHRKTDDAGAARLSFDMQIALPGVYTADWYDADGKSLQSDVWNIETQKDCSTSIQEPADGGAYLIIRAQAD